MCYLNNICFVCLSNKDNLIAVYHKETDNEIFMQVKYALPELIFKAEIPVLYICSSCNTTLHSFVLLKKKCLENYSRLSDYINVLQRKNDTPGQSISEVQIKVNNCVPLVNHENNINLNSEENEDALEHDQKPEVADNVEVKEESLTSEDSNDRTFYQHFVKCEYVSDDELDGDSSVTREDNNALDKDETNSNTHTNNQNFHCLICNEVLTDRLTFDSHLIIHFNSITDSKCLICHKRICNKYYLKRHMKFHFGIKDFECLVCNKTFTNSSNLNKHMKLHEGIKNYDCSICKKKFFYRGALNDHMKMHAGVKDYECSICKKKFSRSGYLKIHMKIHAGIKEYECTICKKRFSQCTHLKTHMKTHAGKKDYKCSICNKKFALKDYLKKHVETHQNG